MGLESATYVNDLVTSNPIGATDFVSQGDDHLRLLKAALKNTLKNADREQYLDNARLQSSASLTLTIADGGSVIVADANSNAITITLPAFSTVPDGWNITVLAYRATVNTVTVQRAGSDSLLSAISSNSIVVLNGDSLKIIAESDTTDAWYGEYRTGIQRFAAQHLYNGGNIINGHLVWSVAGNALTVALKNSAGNDPSTADPVLVRVRDATATADEGDWLTVTSALSVVLSNGSTVGTINSTAFRLWAVLFNDAGTARLGLVNCLDSNLNIKYLRNGYFSSTAEGGVGGADSAHTIYTGTAVSSKGMTILGYGEWDGGLSTAGAWASGPTLVQLWSPGCALPGEVLQTAGNVSATANTISATIPEDNTIPQITEGEEVMTQAIVPVSKANIVLVEHKGLYSREVSSGNSSMIVALFRDAVSDALRAVLDGPDIAADAGFTSVVKLRHLERVGSVSSTTYRVRAGASGDSSGNTASGFNTDISSASLFGGVLDSYLQAQEIMA